MSAPPLPYLPLEQGLEGVAKTLDLLVNQYNYEVVVTNLDEDIGLMDMDNHLIHVDHESNILDQAYFLQQCLALVAFGPYVATSMEAVTGRHLTVVDDL
ncbi:hypothetical protein ABT341_00485 [Pseudonocardia alni]|uniref:hypothetical protein n=1 Tax=Pseudonocardia alni TaxID=33907 RepID=UPI00332D3EEB